MTPDQIAAEIAEKAVPSMTPEEIAELRDRLSEGVICTGETETDDGVTELYDVDDATDAMADAACAIDQLLADRTALLAKVERYERALTRLGLNAALLLENAKGCAVNHYGHDIELNGMPGWLADCEREINDARAALEVKP